MNTPNISVQSIQLETIRGMASQCQSIVARHDDLLFKIKALAATIWSLTCGWALTASSRNLLFVALVAVVGLWFVAAAFRGAQKRYIRSSDVIHRFLTDPDALSRFAADGTLPDTVPRCLGGYEGRLERALLLWRGLRSPTVSMFYGLFAVITVLLLTEVRWGGY